MASTVDENKAVVRKHIEAFNERDRKGVRSCFAADAKPHGLELDEFLEAEFGYLQPFPDHYYEINDVFGEGDRVAIHWTFIGTHEGEWLDHDPTHERVEIEGINLARVENGEIVDYTGTWDVHELLDAIGVIELPT